MNWHKLWTNGPHYLKYHSIKSILFKFKIAFYCIQNFAHGYYSMWGRFIAFMNQDKILVNERDSFHDRFSF